MCTSKCSQTTTTTKFCAAASGLRPGPWPTTSHTGQTTKGEQKRHKSERSATRQKKCVAMNNDAAAAAALSYSAIETLLVQMGMPTDNGHTQPAPEAGLRSQSFWHLITTCLSFAIIEAAKGNEDETMRALQTAQRAVLRSSLLPTTTPACAECKPSECSNGDQTTHYIEPIVNHK